MPGARVFPLFIVGCARALVLPFFPPGPSVAYSASSWRIRSASLCASDCNTAEEWLKADGGTVAAGAVVAFLDACREIASKISTASCDSTACFNDYGIEQEQLAINLLAEEVIMENLRRSGSVAVASSESDQVVSHVTPAASLSNPLSVAFDPIDASSILDTNFAVGTIFGVWQSDALVNVSGKELLAAGTCTYGPRTAITLALADRAGAHEFLLVHGDWVRSNSYEVMGEGKLFAPGNLRATAAHPGYASLVQYWMDNRYQLRYTGGVVADVTQLMVKGRGIFVSPAAPQQRPALKLLYQALPLAFLMDKAGGSTSDGESSLLDLTVHKPDDRTQVALGSAAEVSRFESMVGPRSR